MGGSDALRVRGRLWRCPRRGAVMLAVPIAAVGVAAAALWSPACALAATPTKVTATITNSRIVFAPSYVPTGTVVITVVNRTKGRREFGVGAHRTGAIAPGRSERLTVTFSGSGERQFSSAAVAGSHITGGSRRLTAAIHLFEPCSDPSSTTVDAQIDQSAGGLTLSPTTVPCGTVTFDFTDVDTANVRLVVAAYAPPLSGLTTQLNAGGTTTLTVSFPATTLIQCDAIQIGGDGVVSVIGKGSIAVE